jgi:hypothetical protein
MSIRIIAALGCREERLSCGMPKPVRASIEKSNSLCAASVELCVSVVAFGRKRVHHRGTEFHRDGTEKDKIVFRRDGIAGLST